VTEESHQVSLEALLLEFSWSFEIEIGDIAG
jgi:hypothetical protein